MPDKKLTDSEIIKEIQSIRESMKRHIYLTNEMGQDLLRIDEEYTGGSKIWLTTDYFKKVVKHFCHSNYLVKCMELIFEHINRLQAENERLRNANGLFEYLKQAVYYNDGLIREFRTIEDRDEAINKMVKKFSDLQTAKAEAYKEFAKLCIDKSKNGIIQVSDMPDYVIEMVGDNQ